MPKISMNKKARNKHERSADSKLELLDRNGTHGTLDLAATPPDGNKSQLVCVRFGDDAQVRA